MPRHVVSCKVIDVQKRRVPSKHYTYVVDVVWSDGSELQVYRRYSQFFEFHVKILDAFPAEAGEDADGRETERIIPYLPGKKLFGRSHTRSVAVSRIKLLDGYLQELIQLPEKLSRWHGTLDFFEPDATDIKPPTASERDQKPASIVDKLLGKQDELEEARPDVVVGEVLILDQYRAVADYKKQEKTEVSLKTGDIIEVVDKNDNGWWFVTTETEQQGWVPATYLEPLEGPDEEAHTEQLAAGGEKYIAMQAYKASRDDEIGYDKGAVVMVLQKNLDGWWKVEFQGKTGWTPGSHLEKLRVQNYVPSGIVEETSALEFKGNKDKSQASAAAAPPPRPADPDVAQVVRRNKNAPPRRESIHRPQSIHGAAGKFHFAQELKSAAGKAEKAPAKSASSTPASASSSPDKAKPARPQGPTDKAQSTPDMAKPTRPKEASKQAGIKKPERPSQPQAATQPADDAYITVSDFKATDDSTIGFPEGAKVRVVEKSDTGWWFIEYNGKEGWAPEEFLEKQKAVDAAPNKPSRPDPVAKVATTVTAQSGSAGTKGLAAVLKAGSGDVKGLAKPATPAAVDKPKAGGSSKPDAGAASPLLSKAALKPVVVASKGAAKPTAATAAAASPAVANKPPRPSTASKPRVSVVGKAASMDSSPATPSRNPFEPPAEQAPARPPKRPELASTAPSAVTSAAASPNPFSKTPSGGAPPPRPRSSKPSVGKNPFAPPETPPDEEPPPRPPKKPSRP
eukprot:m.365161 g.365161  ORF g.365161 m.365161 type:complete len:738 (+) comp19971_c0_seq14:2102-4315(+)